MKTLVLYSKIACRLWVERVIRMLNYVGSKVDTYEVPCSIGLLDVDLGFKLDVYGSYNLLLCLGVPPELLLVIPECIGRLDFETLIVPVEDPKWVPYGLQKQVENELKPYDIECLFPRPFCSLSRSKRVNWYTSRLGTPELEVRVENDRISSVKVLRSSPCGSTLDVVKYITGLRVNEALYKIALVQSFYCFASHDIDPTIGDSLHHISCHIVRRALEKALSKEAPHPSISTGNHNPRGVTFR